MERHSKANQANQNGASQLHALMIAQCRGGDQHRFLKGTHSGARAGYQEEVDSLMRCATAPNSIKALCERSELGARAARIELAGQVHFDAHTGELPAIRRHTSPALFKFLRC